VRQGAAARCCERIKLTAAVAAVRVWSFDAPMGDDSTTLLELIAG
jgi:hypothetical protein